MIKAIQIQSTVLNTNCPPKYKSKIERKIDALLTITDTYVHTYISTNLNTSSVVECFSTAAAIVIVVVIFRILCCLKENVLKACLVLLSTAHTFMTHRHTHNRRHIVLQYFRCLCAFIPVELRVWRCSYIPFIWYKTKKKYHIMIRLKVATLKYVC